MSEEKTPGQLSYEARQVAKGRRMGANDGTPDSEILAVIALGWDELPSGMQADEEAGAQAVLDNRAPQPAPEMTVALANLLARWQRDVKPQPDDTSEHLAERRQLDDCARDLAAILLGRPPQYSADPEPAPGHLAVMRGTIAVRDAEIELLRRGCGVHPGVPGYEHPECGFHWHGKDGTDVPLDDRREPACPRCERDGLRNALHAISLGISQPSPRRVAEDALNGRYFDPMNDAGVWQAHAPLRLADDPAEPSTEG